MGDRISAMALWMGGRTSGRKYPWGNEKFSCRQAMIYDEAGPGRGRGYTTFKPDFLFSGFLKASAVRCKSRLRF